MDSKYRIITHDGKVNVQRRWTFLWWSGWSYVNGYTCVDEEPQAQNYGTVEIAKEYIDRRLAKDLSWNQHPIIIPYPALGFPNPALKPS